MLQAMRIAEHPDVLLPVMVTFDGFIISHTAEVLEALEDAEVKNWVGEHEPKYSLLEHRRPRDVRSARPSGLLLRAQAAADGGDVARSGDHQGDREGVRGALGAFVRPVRELRLEDAELVIVALGSTCGTTKVVIDELRDEGHEGRAS